VPNLNDDATIDVCMAIRALIPGGGTGLQIQLARLLPHLRERGITATVVAGRTRNTPRRDHMYGSHVRRSFIPGFSPVASADFTSEAILYLARRRSHLQLLHAHGAIHPGVVGLAAARMGIPAVVTLTRAGSRSDFSDLLERRWGARQLRSLVARTSFIALSSVVKEELMNQGVDEDRIFSIPGGVDLNHFHPATDDEKLDLRTRLGLGTGPLLISTSRLVGVKRLEIVIQAMDHFSEGRFVLVGDGSEKSALEDLVLEKGLGDRVEFAGAKRDVHNYLRAADIFVLPSSAEGLSNAMLEAMACGLPCVVSRIAGPPELFGSDRGVVLDSTDPEEWAKSLIELIAHPRLRAEIGTRASELVTSEYTLERTADKTVDAYRKILELHHNGVKRS
jgi:glycosyltransferase involved in cell wall biosynthesis